ncbi:hypothetical protein PCE1_004819 [Barthelona sp. PCE]
MGLGKERREEEEIYITEGLENEEMGLPLLSVEKGTDEKDDVDVEKLVSWSNIWKMSLPALVKESLAFLPGLVRTAVIGHTSYSEIGQQAFSIISSIMSPIGWVFVFLINGVTSQVGGEYGKSKFKNIGRMIRLVITAALLLGFLTQIPLLILTPSILRWFDAKDKIFELTVPFLRMRLITVPFLLLARGTTGILQGLQRVNSAMIVQFMIVGFDLVGHYVFLTLQKKPLIYSAYSTCFAQVAASMIGFLILVVPKSSKRLRIFSSSSSKEKKEVTWSAFISSSFVLFLRSVALQMSFVLAAKVTSNQLPTKYMSAYLIILQLWFFNSFVIDGFAIVANMVGSRLIAAGELPAFRLLRARLLSVTVTLGFILMGIFWLFEERILGIVSNSDATIELCRNVWYILLIMQVPNSLCFYGDGLLLAAKEFKFLSKYMWVGFLGFYLPIMMFQYIVPPMLDFTFIAIASMSCVRFMSGLSLSYYKY